MDIQHRIQTGMTVRGSDGGTVGTVVGFDGQYVVVEQGSVLPADHDIPTSAIASVGGGDVYLGVPRDEAVTRGWDRELGGWVSAAYGDAMDLAASYVATTADARQEARPMSDHKDLHAKDLSWANLSGADLRGADLREATLVRVTATGADLKGADLTGADLTEANLADANPRDARLDGATLADADLRGADLKCELPEIPMKNVVDPYTPFGGSSRCPKLASISFQHAGSAGTRKSGCGEEAGPDSAMATVHRTSLAYLPSTEEVANLYIVPTPHSASTEFCSLVARALRCRTCSFLLFGPDGDLIANNAYGPAPGPVPQVRLVTAEERPAEPGLRPPLDTPERRQSRGRRAGEVGTTRGPISLSLTLPGEVTGTITVADREDGTLFNANDRDLLESLTTLYASTFATPARYEFLRLQNDVRSLRKQAIEAEEHERQRLARELHDDVGHAITTAILSIDMIARRLPGDSVAVHALTSARESLTECADCLNEFAFHLRPRILNDLGVAPALRGLVRRVREVCALDVSVVVYGQERRLSDETELAAFRVAQEALTNALKHSRPTNISIHVTYSEDYLNVEVRDDGVGFDPARARLKRGRHGQGLLGMREGRSWPEVS